LNKYTTTYFPLGIMLSSISMFVGGLICSATR
jgi:hypothetical protein